MQVQIGYEDIAGEPFAIESVGQTAKSRAALYAAAIIAANPDKEIDTAKILSDATIADLKAIDDAVGACMQEFYNIPAIAEQHVPEPTEEEKEEGKNA